MLALGLHALFLFTLPHLNLCVSQVDLLLKPSYLVHLAADLCLVNPHLGFEVLKTFALFALKREDLFLDCFLPFDLLV